MEPSVTVTPEGDDRVKPLVSLSDSVAVSSALTEPYPPPDAECLMTAVPLSPSWSSAAWRVTVWSELQFEVVKVRDDPVLTLMSESWLPVVLRATVTVTLALGLVASFTL